MVNIPKEKFIITKDGIRYDRCDECGGYFNEDQELYSCIDGKNRCDKCSWLCQCGNYVDKDDVKYHDELEDIVCSECSKKEVNNEPESN